MRMSKLEYIAPLSPKGMESLVDSTSFINIWEGAVRSSKTFCSIVRWIEFVAASPHSTFMMTGKTQDSLFRNVLDGDYGLINLIGEANIRYKKASEGGSKLVWKIGGKEKTIYCIGANDESSEGRIRGMTLAGWYADEITLYPESFVKQAINRLSLHGAKAFWTTNPDSPYHYIYTEFIEKAQEKGYTTFHFTLDDNNALSKEYRENIKSAYSGLWYQRMILGLWVMAEGVIYNLFDNQKHVIDHKHELPDMVDQWIGVDYGTSNATTFIHCGKGRDGALYVLNEYCHSGRDGVAKSPSQYAKDLKRFISQYEIRYSKIFIDPSAEGFMLQLWQEGIRGVTPADNAVLRGIESVSNLMAQDKFYVRRTCKHVLRELSSYVWDEKAQQRGEDKPKKENDHCLDPIRYIVNSTRTLWFTRGR